MDDLISRQAAIDAVIKRDANCGKDSAEVLKLLPSAEPEIIRCKDCRWGKERGENMVVPIPTEVIPVWYIEKWKKENAENGSALEHFISQLIKDWHVEENGR